MTVRYIEQRYCDVCGSEYADTIKTWMVINAPNLGEDAPTFDLCSWDCMTSWVQSNDDEDEPEDAMEESAIVIPADAPAPTPAPAQQAPRPAMTLADAIMSGQLDSAMRRAR